MKKLDLFIVSEMSSIANAMERFEANLSKIVFIENKNNQIIGSLSDGDIRRGLLSGCNLESSVLSCVNKKFVFVPEGASQASILKQFDRDVNILPMIDENGLIIDVILKEDFLFLDVHPTYVLSRAPTRVTFSGGGSDVTYYFADRTGAVLNAAINRYCNVALRKRSDKQIHVISFDLDKEFNLDDFEDLELIPSDFKLIKAILKFVKPNFGFDLHVNSDFSVGSGLGGSSTLVVAVLEAFSKLRGDFWTKREIAEFSFKIERLDLGVSGGWQDQYAAAYGGINFIQFTLTDTKVVPVNLEDADLRALEGALLLCDTGIQHESGQLHKEQKVSVQNNGLNEVLDKSVQLAHEMRSRLEDGDLSGFSEGLNKGWMLKRGLSDKITNHGLDKIYNLAIASGASGGKLLGAGGGGHFLFICPPFSKGKVARALTSEGLYCSNVSFDNEGAKSFLIRDVKEDWRPI